MDNTNIRCANCGSTLNGNQKFCGICGAPVSSGQPIGVDRCTRCGNELNKGAMFCNKCGTPVGKVNLPDAAKKGIYKKVLGITASVVVVLSVGIAVAVGSDNSGRNEKSESASVNSVMTESAEKGGNTADKPVGVQETGIYTVSEYINSSNRLILYRLKYEKGEGEYGVSRSATPVKDEFCDDIYILENGKMSYYYCVYYEGEGLNHNLLYFKELSKMTDDEIVEAVKERYDAKFVDRPVDMAVYTNGTGNSVEYETITAGYDENGKHFSAKLNFMSAYPQTTATVYDSNYNGIIGKDNSGTADYYYWYRGNGLFLTLDGLDSEGVAVDP